MSKFKIDEVSIKNFRGFKKETVFKFDNNYNAIIVSGMNGIGKTSLYDAIEWVFTGELIRYSESSEEKNCKFINFQPSESDELAKVSIVLKNEEASFIVIRELCKMRRSVVSDYGSKKTKLTVILPKGKEIHEKDAEEFIDENLINKLWKGKARFKDVFGQYHLLSQDKIKYFVQGIKMPERYEYFANLLGNERYLKIIPRLKEEEALINSNLQKINENIDAVNQKIAILSNKNINNANLSAFNIQELESEILNDIEEINNISKIYNLGFNLDTNDISVKGIEKLNKDIANIYILLEEIKNKNLKERNELNEIKIGYSQFIQNLDNDKKYELLLEFYKKLDKLKYLDANKEQYKIYEKNKLDRMNRKKAIQNEIKMLEQKRNFIQPIYFELLNYNTELNQRYGEKINIKKIIELIENNKILFNKDDLFICIDDENRIHIKSINENIQDNLNNKFSIFKESTYSKILNLQNQCSELEKVYHSNNISKVNMQNQIKDLSDMDKDLKNVLIEARDYINKQKSSNCPICDSFINYKSITDKIDGKLNNSNPIIEKLNASLRSLEANIKFNEMNLENKIKSLNDCAMEYSNYISRLKQIIEDKLFQIKNEISLKQKNIQSIESELNDLEKINDKYTILTKEFMIKNLDIDIYECKKYIENDIKNLGLNDEERKIDKVSSLKYNNDLNIKLYKEKIKNKNIDINIKNMDKHIEILIEVENKKIILLEEQLNKIKKIKERIKITYGYLKENEDYKNLKNHMKELKMLEHNKMTNENKIKDINKLKSAIEDVVSNLNQEIMEDNKNMINSVFRKIFPNPYYKQLDFIFDKSRNKDTLKLQCKHINDDTTINPAYIFSSTQINIISVSIFLAIAIKQNCTNLDLILLDDPVQNMDDMNVLSFIDVLRGCIDQNVLDKQIIISTHDERVTNLFAKKFRFFNTKICKFVEYTKEGPKVEFKELNGQLRNN